MSTLCIALLTLCWWLSLAAYTAIALAALAGMALALTDISRIVFGLLR